MTTIPEALTVAVPLYNMALVLIVIALFLKLFKEAKPKTFIKPWKVMFAAVLVFIVEELLTILRDARIIVISAHINGFFELVIVSMIIYMLLLQKEYAKKVV